MTVKKPDPRKAAFGIIAFLLSLVGIWVLFQEASAVAWLTVVGVVIAGVAR